MATLPKEVREFLKEYEPAPYACADAEGLLRLKNHAIDAKQKAEEARKTATGASAVFATMCPHTNKVVDTEYVPGDYYDTSYTIYKVMCTFCNSKLFEFDGTNSRYG
jgi:hypothetical protein